MVRLSGPRILSVFIPLALVAYTFVLAPMLAERRSGESAHAGTGDNGREPTTNNPTPKLFPPPGKAFIGVATKEGIYDFGPVDKFQAAIQHNPSVMMVYRGWADRAFNADEFNKVAERGMLPMLSWEPWNYQDDSKDKDGTHAGQPEYQLSRIYGGAFDDYIRSYALGIKNLDYRVAIRFAHEMNGFWYPWGANVNGNRGDDYIKAWRHVRNVFTEAGATNVIWVWSPNVILDRTQLAPFYPGDDFVDWVGLSGYYGTEGTRNYRSPDTIFNSTLAHIRTFTKRPVVITETAATDSGGMKARWVVDFFRYLPQHPEIIGIIWYESVREWDWRIATAPAAAAAFAAGAADPRYAVPWSKDVVPLTTAGAGAPEPTASAKVTTRPSPTPDRPTPRPSTTRTPDSNPTSRPSASKTPAPPPSPPPADPPPTTEPPPQT